MSVSTPQHPIPTSSGEQVSMQVRVSEKVSWTPSEAALMLSISTSTFLDWVRKGIMPQPIKGTSRYSAAAVRDAAARGSGLRSSTPANLSALEIWGAEND
jgi:predicted DNA-binding transcriptional regulator AlpA